LKTRKPPDLRKCGRFIICRSLTFSVLILAIRAIASTADPGPPAPEKTTVPDTLRIGLQEAILMGLENNPTVMIQRLEPEIIRTAVKENSAAFDPVLDVTGAKSESKSQRRLGAQRTPFDLQDDRFDMSAQITEFLPTGTTLSVTAGMTGSVSNLYTDQYTGSAGLNVTQSLLKGFGFCANLAGYRQARLDLEISRSELKGIAESVTADIEKGYWDLYLTRQETGIQQQSLALAEQQLAESLERVAVGKLPELELAAVHAEVAARHGFLIDALSRYEQARLNFLYLINPRTETFWETVPLPAERPFMPLDTLDAVAGHEQVGIKLRPDLEQARLELKKGELEVARTKNGLLPQLDIFLSLGRTTYSEVFREAYPELKSPFYQANAGLTFSFPVTDRAASAQWQRARYSRDQQRLAVLNMEKLVQWDIRSAYVEVLRARQQIEATHVTREMQEKKLSAELEKFRVGKSTNFLVLQAQRDFTASQLDEARAMVVYLNALVDLYVSEGSLLERRGLESLDDSVSE
jgi:outer membrane protein